MGVEVRYNIFTSFGYRPELITILNQKKLATKGYMQSPNDWRNVEITAYLKLDDQGGYITGASGGLLGVHYTMYARGGMHKGFGTTYGGCEGTSYHVVHAQCTDYCSNDAYDNEFYSSG
jgi:hypothetical protein